VHAQPARRQLRPRYARLADIVTYLGDPRFLSGLAVQLGRLKGRAAAADLDAGLLPAARGMLELEREATTPTRASIVPSRACSAAYVDT
jgi:hypothetical protein